MEDFEVGVRFPSYISLMESLNNFCKRTNTKFWKRDARTITAVRNFSNKFFNLSIKYYEIKFSCVYGGIDFISRSRNIRIRHPSLKSTGCPAYLRFKATDDGDCLQLVAKNLSHNHELTMPERKRRPMKTSSHISKRKDNLNFLKHLQNVEIREENGMDNIELLESKNCFDFQGLIVPVFTPFHNDKHKSLNLDILPSYAEYLVNAGISGILVNGTTGEGMCMNVNERKILTETWADLCVQTQQHLMVQVGGVCLSDVLELAHHAEQKGVNSLLCLPELYHKPSSATDLIRYLKLVAQAAPRTPLLYYHIPSFTNVNINMGKFLNEIGDAIPTFSGIKFTSTALDEGVSAIRANFGKFSVFLGADTIMAGAFALGFDSAIATTLNIFPYIGQQIMQYINDGNILEAQNAQNNLNSAIEIITKDGDWVPTMKEAMNIITSINLGPSREPLRSLTSEQVEDIRKMLQNANFIPA